MKLNQAGEVEIVEQFGLDPAAPSGSHGGETRAQWVARENQERATWPNKYTVQDWRIVPAKRADDIMAELRRTRGEEAAIYTHSDYFPLVSDCNTAAQYFCDHLPAGLVIPVDLSRFAR